MKKRKYIIIWALPVLSLIFACSEKKVESRFDFNKSWKFNLGEDSLAYAPNYDDSGWCSLSLPHDWSIEGEFSNNNLTNSVGAASPDGIGWYRKVFVLNAEDKEKQIYVDFDGIYRNSEVWINGHSLGKRANGHISFRYELTPYLKFDGSNNTIAVKADNSHQPNSHCHTGSGIYRNTWLVKLPKVHFKHWGIFITTPEISDKEAIVQVKAQLEGNPENYKDLEIKTTVMSPSGKSVASRKTKMSAKEINQGVQQELNLSNPEPWSPEKPKLYKVNIELYANGELIQTEKYPLGIRKFHFTADSGFFLNGKTYEVHGVNLPQELGALGAAINTAAIQRQLKLMKEMGVNTIRTAHTPPAPELLNLCDRMGFLVIDEAFDIWNKNKVKCDYNINSEENHYKDLTDLILRDRNHPSVFMWGIDNKGCEQLDSSRTSLAKEQVSIVKQSDTTRAVSCALTETDPSGHLICQFGTHDALGFNYKDKGWAKFLENYPGQKIIDAENRLAYATSGYDDTPFDSAREPESYKRLAKSSYYGVVDMAGFPKDVYYLYQSLWTDKPVLHVYPHWNWEEGQEVAICAYYNQADEVELYLNGKSLGVKRKQGNDMHVTWHVKYRTGSLVAVSRKNGHPVLKKTVLAAGEPQSIVLSPERNVIHANGKDLCFVTAKVVDKHGVTVPNANNLIKFKVKGSGLLAGVDNGVQACQEPIKSSQKKTLNGKCLAIIQSDGEQGNIELEAFSEGLKPYIINIETK